MKQRNMFILIVIPITIAAAVIAILMNALLIGPIGQKTYCLPEQRDADGCAGIYQPVCGWFDSSMVRCLVPPCAATFPSPCFACMDPNVEFWTAGECPRLV
jgi:hypothetical protein